MKYTGNNIPKTESKKKVRWGLLIFVAVLIAGGIKIKSLVDQQRQDFIKQQALSAAERQAAHQAREIPDCSDAKNIRVRPGSPTKITARKDCWSGWINADYHDKYYLIKYQVKHLEVFYLDDYKGYRPPRIISNGDLFPPSKSRIFKIKADDSGPAGVKIILSNYP